MRRPEASTSPVHAAGFMQRPAHKGSGCGGAWSKTLLGAEALRPAHKVWQSTRRRPVGQLATGWGRKLPSLWPVAQALVGQARWTGSRSDGFPRRALVPTLRLKEFACHNRTPQISSGSAHAHRLQRRLGSRVELPTGKPHDCVTSPRRDGSASPRPQGGHIM